MKKVSDLHNIMENNEFDLEALRTRLTKEDEFIFNLIDTIPPKFYFDQEVQEKITADKHSSMDEAAKGIKRNYHKKEELTAKNKHKRARLDPLQHKSVSQIQQEMELQKTPKHKKSAVFASATLTRVANVQELQKRVQERIRELQVKRRGCSEEQLLEKKRLKRQMKKIKKKTKGNTNKPTFNGDNTQNQTKKKLKPLPNAKPKPVYNKDGRMIYSKFDFTGSGKKEFEKKKKGGKNLKKLIEHAEKSQQKIETVKQTDPDKAIALNKKGAWQRAIQKAEGVKLKDDPTLLKKSLKKHEKEKAKTSKVWKNRVQHTEKMQKARQDKRKRNIQSKKKEKIDKKIKKAKKKGRLIPGF